MAVVARWTRRRRAFAALLLAAMTPLAAVPAQLPVSRPQLALTFDDLPRHGPVPAGTSRLAIVRALVGALAAHRAPAFGFMNGAGVVTDDDAQALAAWRAAGLPLGNHTFTHVNLDQVGAAAFVADIDRNVGALAAAGARAEDRRWFRYPFLAEGRDVGARAAVRAALRTRGDRVAAVTMSFGDYAWNDAYARCAADATKIVELEASFLAAAEAEAVRVRAIAHATLGRDIRYVLLLHAGAFDARMLPRLLKLYEKLGFEFTTLAAAQADPFYAAANDLALPGPTATLTAAPGRGPFPQIPLPDAMVCGG